MTYNCGMLLPYPQTVPSYTTSVVEEIHKLNSRVGWILVHCMVLFLSNVGRVILL